jgi:hypothetical protein
MKNIIKIFTAVFLGTWMLSCSPDEHELESVDVSEAELVEGIAFKIEHDANNPNIVYLTSLMDERYTPQWDHPQGRSQERTVTLKIPFAGTYEVKYGVQTRGGMVYGEPVTFTVDEFYAGFVDHELWTLLTGGVDNSKTWIHDNGEYGLATGEMDYADPATTVEWNNFTPNWAPGKGHTGDATMWNSTMTFSLQGGANVDIHNASAGGADESGTFLLDVDSHTITLTDANILHPQSWDFKTTNWAKNLKILTLTENQLRVAVFRELVSGEGEWWLIWNYVSKEYADNYVPVDQPDPEPPYEGDANVDLTTDVSTTKKWEVDLRYPYNWFNLAGAGLNEVQTYGDDPAGFAFTTWAPPYDETVFSSISMTLTKVGASNGTYKIETGAGDYEGSYTIDENNNVNFGQPITFFSGVGGWLNFGSTAENSLRVIISDQDAFGNVTGIWLGQRATDKDEYLALHFKPVAAGPADPAAAWKNALAGKTFKPDVNWFIDWVGFPPDFAGGWTSATTFGSDYTSNGWVWDANVRAVAESASLTFRLEGSDLKVDLVQTKNGSAYSATGDVVIDPVTEILNISIPLVDYAGTAAAWLNTSNPKHISGSANDWHFASHGGSSLANIDTNGLWLGIISQSTAAGDGNDEVLLFHYVKAP